MALNPIGTIAIPNAVGSEFDHGAYDAKSRRIFVAHTSRGSVEVIDVDAGRHIATLPGFPGAAGAVADDGEILVTNRGSASIAWLDADTLETRAVHKTGARPNGAAIIPRKGLGIVACIGRSRARARSPSSIRQPASFMWRSASRDWSNRSIHAPVTPCGP